MNSKILGLLLITGGFIATLTVFDGELLSRFKTISAKCEIGGVGSLALRYQYSSTNEKLQVAINDIDIDAPQVNMSKSNLTIKTDQRTFKIDLDTGKLFANLNNNSYYGVCIVENFKM